MRNAIILFVFLVSIVSFLFTVGADEVGYKNALLFIESIKGRVPDDDDYYSVCENAEIVLSRREQAELFGVILSKQKPTIDTDNLLLIYKAKRASLFDGKISYTEVATIPQNSKRGQAGKTSCTYTFVFSRNKLYLERYGKRWHDDYEHSIMSFDGENVTTVALPQGEPVNADITRTSASSFFYQMHMPLFLTMLFEESRCGYANNTGRDLVESLEMKGATFVFHEEKMANGKRCVIVANSFQRFFLDPECDFSLIRFELFEQIFEENNLSPKPLENTKIIGRRPLFITDHFDLVDKGNGIWIPSRIECAYYTDGKPDGQATITVLDAQFNTAIPDLFFSDVIPDDAFVADGSRGMTYFQSDRASINALLKSVAKSKRVWTFQIISVTLGTLMIIVWVVLKYLAYLKRKNAV